MRCILFPLAFWEVLDAPETIPRWGGMQGPFGVGICNHKTDNRLVFVFYRYEQVQL